MRGQGLAHRRAEAGDDVEHPGRNTRLLDPRREFEGGDRGVVAGLGHNRAAGRQRGRELPAQQQQRRVPRDDRPDHADRFAAGVDEEVRLAGGDGGSLELVGQAGVVVEPLGNDGQLVAHLPRQLAGVAGFQLGEVVGVTRDQVTDLAHQLGPAESGDLAPRSGQRLAGGADGQIDVVGVGVGRGGPRPAGERVDGLIPPPGGGLGPLAADDHREVRKAAGAGLAGLAGRCHVPADRASAGNLVAPLCLLYLSRSRPGLSALGGQAQLRADRLGLLAERGDGAHHRLAAQHVHRRQQCPDRAARRVHLAPPAPRAQLRMVGELRGRAQPGIRDARLVQRGGQLRCRNGGQRRLDDRGELVVVRQPVGIGGEPVVGHQIRPAEDLLAQDGPLPLVLQAEEHLVTAGRGVRAIGGDGGVPGSGPPGRLTAVDAVVELLAHPLAQRVEHGHVEAGPLAGPLPLVQGGQDARVRVHPGGNVRYRDPGLRRLLRRAGYREQAGLALHEQVVGLLMAVRAVRAIPGDGAADQPGVAPPQVFGA